MNDRYVSHLDEYQTLCADTAVFPQEVALQYLTLKLAGETGEVAELVGKHFRGDPDKKDIRDALGKELGDVMWYIAMLADHFDFNLSEIATININKLQDRQNRDVLKGSGDYR